VFVDGVLADRWITSMRMSACGAKNHCTVPQAPTVSDCVSML